MSDHLEPLSPKHARAVILSEGQAITVWEGAVRSAKTVASLIAWVRFVRKAPPGDLVMIGKTERTLIRNVVRPLQRYLGEHRCKLNLGAGEVKMLGRVVYLVGANDETAEGKIRGMTLAGAYGDEITIWPESFWKMLQSRFSVEGARFIGTTNPDGPAHWLAEWIDNAVVWVRHDGTVERHDDDPDRVDRDLCRLSFTIDDNPTLPARYVARLKASYAGVFYQRFILGLWVLAEGVIYGMWSEDRHVIGDDDHGPLGHLHVAVDDATSSTFAALLGGFDDRGRLVIARELRWDAKERQRQITDTQKSKLLADWLKRIEAGTWTTPDGATPKAIPGASAPDAVHVDPSAASLIRQLEGDGWRGTVRKARNDVVEGIRYVSSLLALDRMVVHESCIGLRKERPGYRWDDKAAKRGEDKPVKANDHSEDACRYLVMGTDRLWWDWLALDDNDEADSAV